MFEIKKIRKCAKPYKALCALGELHKSKNVYKYMQMTSFEKCMQGNNLMFKKPVKWPDPFESRFCLADYSQLSSTEIFSKAIYACCVSRDTENEAAWRMYSENYVNDPCVKINISVGQLRRFLDEFASLHDAELYEGQVSYELKDSEILYLHKSNSKYYPTFFNDFTKEKYLNLLTLKRRAFKYEGEIRYLIRGGDFDFSNDNIFIPIPWCLCINSITLSPTCNDKHYEKVLDLMKLNYEWCKREYPNRFPQVPEIKFNMLYTPTKTIIIE